MADRRLLGVGFLVTVAALFLLPAVMDPFRLNLLGKYLCFALVALGLDLLWGYAGQLSLGQSVFFGLGAYLFGHQIMDHGVRTKGELDREAGRCSRA